MKARWNSGKLVVQAERRERPSTHEPDLGHANVRISKCSHSIDTGSYEIGSFPYFLFWRVWDGTNEWKRSYCNPEASADRYAGISGPVPAFCGCACGWLLGLRHGCTAAFLCGVMRTMPGWTMSHAFACVGPLRKVYLCYNCIATGVAFHLAILLRIKRRADLQNRLSGSLQEERLLRTRFGAIAFNESIILWWMYCGTNINLLQIDEKVHISCLTAIDSLDII